MPLSKSNILAYSVCSSPLTLRMIAQAMTRARTGEVGINKMLACYKTFVTYLIIKSFTIQRAF